MEKEVVLITGCSSGIGRSLSIEFQKTGRYIVYATARKLSDLEDLKDQGINTGKLDVTKPSEISEVVKEIIKKNKRIDILINNGGILTIGPIVELDIEEYKRVYDVNVFGVVRMIKAVVPHMIEKKRGKIFNISSIFSTACPPFGGAYSSSKGSVNKISECLRLELMPWNIQVCCVQPGSIKTKLSDNSWNVLKDKIKTYKIFKSKVSEEVVKNRLFISQKKSFGTLPTSSDKFAKDLVNIIKTTENLPWMIRLGKASFLVPFLYQILPHPLMELVLMRKFKINDLLKEHNLKISLVEKLIKEQIRTLKNFIQLKRTISLTQKKMKKKSTQKEKSENPKKKTEKEESESPPPIPEINIKTPSTTPTTKTLKTVTLKKVAQKDKNYIFSTQKFLYGDRNAGKPLVQQTEEDLTEYNETKEVVKSKAKELARIIKNSKHFIIFTGAGVSTSCGIPDYRGPEGVWTCLAQNRVSKKKSISVLKAIPSYTHMSIVELIKSGYCKHLISQNCDGLHRKSGILKEQICELHGNSNLEICVKCKREYLRDYNVYKYSTNVMDHRTGRKCESEDCDGELHDSIINFGEFLKPEIIKKGFSEAKKADVCLVIGSSLVVTPAANIPLTVSRKGKKYIINNLQKTPHDKFSSMLIRAPCDLVLKYIMDELKLEPKPFSLKRKLMIEVVKDDLIVKGLDKENLTFDYIKKVKISNPKKKKNIIEKSKLPFVFNKFQKLFKKKELDLDITLEFYSHYGEPPLTIKMKKNEIIKKNKQILNLKFDVYKNVWSIEN